MSTTGERTVFFVWNVVFSQHYYVFIQAKLIFRDEITEISSKMNEENFNIY